MRYSKTDSGWNLIDYNIFFVPEGADIGPDHTFHITYGGENVVYYMLTNQDTTYIDTIYVGNLPILTSRVCVDNNGIPQIVAGAYDTGQIFHIFKENSVWIVEQVLNFYPYLTQISMKIDIFDNIHLAMASSIPAAIGYACEYPEWSWSILVDSVAEGNINLELSGDLLPGISFNYTPPEGFIKPGLLEFNGSSWDTTYFEASYVRTSVSSFAYDAESTPNLIFNKRGIPPEDRTIIHAYRTPDIWIYDTLFVFSFTPYNIKADSQGNLHLDLSRIDNIGYYFGIKLSTTDIKDILTPNNKYFESLASYPNPFNGEFKIVFKLYREDTIRLDLYDLQGRFVYKFYEAKIEDYRNEFQITAGFNKLSGLASGVYFLKLEGEYHLDSRKILYLK